MGCDIHLVLERKHENRWIAVDTFIGHESAYGGAWSLPIALTRNYERFAALAGVRGDGPEPRGLPDDASETARYLADECGWDGHSHSWMPVKDAARIFAATEHAPPKPESTSSKCPAYYYFGAYDDSADEFRLVFWFDN